MPTKRIRVYELARELGLTNKEALDLSISLGIGVKSHSSSLEDAQADRVRRKAEREGLRRDVQPEEPGQAAPSGRPTGAPAAGAPAAGSPTAGSPDVAPRPPRPDSPRHDDGRLVTSRPSRPDDQAGGAPRSAPPAPPRPAPGVRPAPAPAGDGRPQVPAARTGDGRPADGRPAEARPAAPRPAPPSGAPVGTRPVPPPPGSGRQVPPPPGAPNRPAAPGQGVLRQPAAAPGQAAPRQPAAAAPGQAVPRQPAAAPGQAAPRQPAAAAPGQAAPARPAGVPGQAGAGQGAPRPQSAPPGPAAPGQGTPGQTAPGQAARPPAAQAGQGAPAAQRAAGAGAPRPPLSPSGKPIPPPPGVRRPPVSPVTGKPIPPPPGRGPNARPAAGGGRPSPGAGRSGAPRTGGGFPPRTGGGGGAPGGFRGGPPRGPVGGPPGGGNRGFAGRGGRPGGARRPRGRRRRPLEELEAQEITRYTPNDAPVPEGEIIVERGSTAQELGPKLNRSGADVVRFLFEQGEAITATTSLSDDMIELFAAELGAQIRLVDPGEEQEAELQAKYFDDEDEDEADLRPRPPVVTVMGHVDHGKTMLLDRIRETNVVAGEAGGITQHIGAYQVEYGDQLITFIDTPGHEAFTAMRARGAEVTDIVILVVAADDGVMPQTREALAHAKAADVPIIVAINKVDREDADPNRVMQQLSELGLVPESWGGDTIMVEVSALQNLGIDDLLEQVVVVAEVEELVANPEGRARGIVLEANLDPRQGPVATVIIQNGTLRVGDSVVAGAAWGRVKALIDDHGDNVKEAPPSFPALVLNFDTVPDAGDELRVVDKGRTARDIAEAREQRLRAANQRRTSSATGTGARLEDIFEQIQRGETATLNLVLKADTQGSLEAVTESLKKLERDEVKLSFVHRAVGGITANDVTLAAASNATIIGFNVRPDRGARDLAEAQDVEIRTYEIIYKLIEDIQAAMVGMLAPEFEEVITGDAEVRELFRVPRIGAIAGCYVRNGVITRGSKVRFLRDGVIIWKGAITSLRRFKEDVREVAAGFECGIGLSNNQDLREGDVIETFEEREIPRT